MFERFLLALAVVIACALSFQLGASRGAPPTIVRSLTSPAAPTKAQPPEFRFSEIASLPQQSEARKFDDWRSLTNAAPSRFDPGGRRRYYDLVRIEAEKNDLPTDIADAVAYVESAYDPTRIGDVGEIGLMQIRPTTAYMLGFRGADAQLAEPAVNIHYGVLYLAQAWRLAGGDLCRALMKYRAGHGAEMMTLRSVQYCSRARAWLESLRAPVAQRVGQHMAAVRPAALRSEAGHPAPMRVARLVEPEAPAPKSTHAAAKPAIPSPKAALRARRLGGSERFWAVHEMRIKMLTERLHAKWRRAGGGRRRVT